MPGPGAHLRPSAATTNPFADQLPRVNEYTAVEIASLQSKLDKQLGPEYISTRPGAGGGRVHYLAAEKVINLANEVFGFNGWSSEVKQCDIDFVDEHPETRKISIGLAVIVRVTLRDGTFHEDMGYGQIENCKGKAAAFEKARKEAVTDALKRALRSFGKVLGNCLYDKDYLTRVSKVKMQPARWDEKRLHRHPDFAPNPVKPEPVEKPAQPPPPAAVPMQPPALQKEQSQGTDFEDDFGGGNLFDGVEIGPDEVLMPGDALEVEQRAPRRPPSPAGPPNRHQAVAPPPPDLAPVPVEVGFVTSRAAVGKDEPLSISAVAALPRFNPNSESPSIRKTNGVNHNASAPIKRTSLPGGAQQPADQGPAPPQAGGPRNFVNPAMDPSRRVGMPSGGPSPMGNRGAFKQPGPAAGPGVKRTMPPDIGAARSPLADVSNTGAQVGAQTGRGEETSGKDAGGAAEHATKRARTGA